MRILYITDAFPWPLTSGHLRHYHLIRGLSRRHSVSLLSIVGADFDHRRSDALRPFAERIHTFPTTGRRPPTQLRSALPSRAVAAAEQLAREALELTKDGGFDVCLLTGRRAYPALSRLADIPLVADVCDATSSRMRGALSHAGGSSRPLLYLRYLWARHAERQVIARAEHLVFASPRDRDALVDRRTRGHAAIVPNGVDDDYWRRSTTRLGSHEVVFTGAMSYPPNADAAVYLIREIMPRVQREVPEASLSIVGRDPTPELVAAGSRHGATVTGYVDDMRPHLERAAVFAAPLRFGSGIQNKLLEAMAMEVPVVASPLAGEGLTTEDGALPPIGLAEDAGEFARQLVTHLRSDQPEPSRLGRAFVQQHFSWPSSVERLEAVLNRAGAPTEQRSSSQR
ncbi:MAG: glycosyltransferase [Candidatus Limnocylindria bacterium]